MKCKGGIDVNSKLRNQLKAAKPTVTIGGGNEKNAECRELQWEKFTVEGGNDCDGGQAAEQMATGREGKVGKGEKGY